jgi:hypothetical protein
MLSHLKMIVENNMLRINPEFQDLIVSLRSAYEKGEFRLDKDKTANNDLLDGLMLCLKEYEYGGR